MTSTGPWETAEDHLCEARLILSALKDGVWRGEPLDPGEAVVLTGIAREHLHAAEVVCGIAAVKRSQQAALDIKASSAFMADVASRIMDERGEPL